MALFLSPWDIILREIMHGESVSEPDRKYLFQEIILSNLTLLMSAAPPHHIFSNTVPSEAEPDTSHERRLPLVSHVDKTEALCSQLFRFGFVTRIFYEV